MSHLKSLEEAQPEVEKLPEVSHPKDGMPSAKSCAQTDFSSRTSEQSNLIILGNNGEMVETNDEIGIKYVDLGESYNNFASKIALVDLDPEPKSMAKC
jgi:hypothetical protein